MTATSDTVSQTGSGPARPATPTDGRRDIVGLSRPELAELLTRLGEKPFRVKQLWHWIYHRGETRFDAMTNLGRPLRARLEDGFVIGRPAISREENAADRTRKWLLRFADGKEAETVYIPEDDRGAVCISSQVGCTLTCRFCHTGTQLLVRNLSAGEIVGQFMVARDSYGEWPSPTDETRLLSNIVVMGMGEPLFNYDNLVKALRIVMDPEGIALSKRRITLSTAGVVPEIRRAAADLGVKLAVSLHAPTDALRDTIMPINKKYPIAELMAACRDYQDIAGHRQHITLEYVMLDGINDSDADARALLRLVEGLGVKFNLIPFNKWPGAAYDCSPMDRIKRFSRILQDANYAAPIRMPRGREILAACGQLKSESERERRHRIAAA